VRDETGVIYNLFDDRWQLSSDMDVNYMVVSAKAAAAEQTTR
jgi:2-polyprenyl-3-methyl-5-hydroxy-6-metoxy-1,4-benzoquinol methylase